MTTDLWQESRLLIDGQLVESSDGGTFENVNPATELVIGVTSNGTSTDMDSAITSARRAFDGTSWSTDPSFRSQCLRQLSEALHFRFVTPI
jgi:aldehyde dehydrogenase (NAD+)